MANNDICKYSLAILRIYSYDVGWIGKLIYRMYTTWL